jgi:hypothetical protein
VVLVLAATGAELGELETRGSRLLVLGGGVVPLLTGGALESNDLAHDVFPLLLKFAARHAATNGGSFRAASNNLSLRAESLL